MPPQQIHSVAWVTGVNGLIGSEIVRQGQDELRWKSKALGRAELDLLKPERIAPLVRTEKPGAIIHCAALSKSPACEADPDLPYFVFHALNPKSPGVK